MSSTHILVRSWWILALRGVAALLFGVAALALPGLTLGTLIALFAAYALLAGAVSVAGAIGNRKRASDWGILLLLGLISLVAGGLAALAPGLTALALALVIGINALCTGTLDIALAIRSRKSRRGAWLLLLSAAISLLFGMLILAYPAAGILALLRMISVYACLTGILYLALAFLIYRGRWRGPRLVDDIVPGGARKGPERRVAERRAKPAGH